MRQEFPGGDDWQPDLLVGPPASGKTLALLRRSAESGYHIVSMSHGVAAALTKRAKQELGVDIPRVFTFDDLLQGHTEGVSGLLIDNTQQLLHRLARGRPIGAVTWASARE